MLSRAVLRHLETELARSDPWGLQSSEFEQRRHAAMLRMLGADERFESALEIGCAAGVFSEQLAGRCDTLRVVDALPEAIERCRARLGDRAGVRYAVADVSEEVGWSETYDLVVVSEVLYYLGSMAAIERAIANLCPLVRPRGVLLFGSAIDRVVRGWGLRHGAEAAMGELSKKFREVARESCADRSSGARALLVKYVRDP